MNSKVRHVLLEVDDSRCDELLAALLKRDYIKLSDVNSIGTRLTMKSCPACLRDFSRISYKTVDEALLWGLLAILRSMKFNRSVVLYESESEIRPIDKERSVKFTIKLFKMATALKLITLVTDGSMPTYFVNMTCIRFLKGEQELTPAIVAVSDDRILSLSGSLHIDQVQGKDSISGLKHDLLDAIRHIPKDTLNFVTSGQTLLL